MNVLIIGGTRFLGAAVARELVARGSSVTVFHRGQTAADLPETVTHVLGDARDPSLVEETLKTGFFGAVVDTILRVEDLEWYLPLLEQHTGCLVHCGSTGVYAPMAAVPAREDDPTPCPAEYGGFAEKRDQDQVLLAFHERTGFNACSLRVSNVFGAGDVPLDGWGARDPKYFQRMADGLEIWIPERGRALLQPVHVSDLARGFCNALETDKVAGQVYNLSSDRAVTLDEYARLGMKLLGSDSPVRHVSMDEILATGKTNEGGLRFICEHMSIDWGKAHQDFGYTPQISVRKGLRDSLQWMVDQDLLDATVAPA